MIEVRINQESFAYDIHSLIKAFYPEEEVNVREKAEFTEDVPLQMEAFIGEEEIEFAVYENGALQKKSRVCVENPERKIVKNQLTYCRFCDSILKYRFGVVRAPEKNGSGSVPAKATEYVSVAQLDRATAF